jgi:hypothetical protein
MRITKRAQYLDELERLEAVGENKLTASAAAVDMVRSSRKNKAGIPRPGCQLVRRLQ